MFVGLELEDRDEIRCVDERLVLRPLAAGQDALVSPIGEFTELIS